MKRKREMDIQSMVLDIIGRKGWVGDSRRGSLRCEVGCSCLLVLDFVIRLLDALIEDE
jgi:hypothetical protein